MADAEGKKPDQGNAQADDGVLRFNLAKWVIVFVFSVTGGLGVVAIIVGAWSPESRFPAIKDVLSIILPAIGVWAGTVIAFYFGRENFESASRSSAALVKQLTSEEKLKSIFIKDVMINMTTAVTYVVDKPEKDIKVKSDLIDAKLEKEKKERLPFLDSQGRIKYMAHRSLLDKFIVQEVAKNKKIEDLTLQDMLNDDDFKNVLTGSFKTLPQTSNLSQAKSLMNDIKICSDIFATEDGNVNSKVLGWVTNVIVEAQSKV
jgi:hypothetical protein